MLGEWIITEMLNEKGKRHTWKHYQKALDFLVLVCFQRASSLQLCSDEDVWDVIFKR